MVTTSHDTCLKNTILGVRGMPHFAVMASRSCSQLTVVKRAATMPSALAGAGHTCKEIIEFEYIARNQNSTYI